jgi:hypothetical protein
MQGRDRPTRPTPEASLQLVVPARKRACIWLAQGAIEGVTTIGGDTVVHRPSTVDAGGFGEGFHVGIAQLMCWALGIISWLVLVLAVWIPYGYVQ